MDKQSGDDVNYPRILRQERPLATAATVQVQKDSRILAVRMLREDRQRMYTVPYFEFWYTGAINPADNDFRERTIFTVGTGNPIPDDATRYIETVVCGEFIWHFFSDEEE